VNSKRDHERFPKREVTSLGELLTVCRLEPPIIRLDAVGVRPPGQVRNWPGMFIPKRAATHCIDARPELVEGDGVSGGPSRI
jgi:hypothetical protein